MENIDIFIAYSQADIAQVKELEKHLAALERAYPIKIWYDGVIEAGKDWETEVNAAMDRAEIILLMLSSDFIASDFWYEKAIPHILELNKLQKIVCLPILVRNCLWEDTPISQMKVLPAMGKTLVNETWTETEEPYIQIANTVKDIVLERLNIKKSQKLAEKMPVDTKKYVYIGVAVLLLFLLGGFILQRMKAHKKNIIVIEKAEVSYKKYITLGNIMLQGKPTLENYVWAREQYKKAISAVHGLPIDSIQAFTRQEKCTIEIEARRKYIIVNERFIADVIAYQAALDTAHTIFLEGIALHKKGEIVNARNRYRFAFKAYEVANRVSGSSGIEPAEGSRGHYAAQVEIEGIDDKPTVLSAPIFSTNIKIEQEMDPFVRDIALFMQRREVK